MGRTLEMEFLVAIKEYIVWIFGGVASYLMYQHQRAEAARRIESERLNSRLAHLEQEVHRLDKSQAETSVEIKAIKEDIGYIRIGLDKILERL